MIETRRRWTRYAAIWLVALVATSAHILVTQPDADGDEPHYLLIARSLVHDHDLDLADDYNDVAQVLEVYPPAAGSPLDPFTHAARYDGRPELRPIHGVGVALIVTPVVALGGGTTATRLWMALLSSLLWPLLLAVTDRLFGRRSTGHAVALLGVALTLPWLPYGGQLFPEPVGALLVVAVLWVVVCGRTTPAWLAFGASLAMVLPWIHVRFSILAAGLLTGLLLRVGGADRSLGSVPPALGRLWRRPRAVAAVLLPGLVGAGLLFAYNAVLYGSPSPNAAYAVEPFISGFHVTPSRVYEWAVADLFSPVFGLLPYGPVALLALAGIAALLSRVGWPAALATAVVVVYYLVATSYGKDGGWCPPGRFACVFVPLLAVPLAAALGSSRRAWVLLVPLVLYGLALSVSATQNFRDLYTSQADRTLLPLARRAAAAWPQFPSRLPDRLSTTSSTRVEGGARLLVAELRPGTYAASLTTPASSLAGADGRMSLETFEGVVVASQPLSDAPLVFAAPREPVQLLVRTTAPAAVDIAGASIEPAALGSVEHRRLFDTVPLVLVWTGILVLMALAIRPVGVPSDPDGSHP